MTDLVAALAMLSRRLNGVRGRGALSQGIFNGLPSARTGTWVIPMKRGHIMRVPRSSAQTWVPAFTGKYDEEELGLLSSFLERGAFALDIGACFGFYTVAMAAHARAIDCRVLAFEPVPRNLQVLTQNVTANSLSGIVDIIPVALGSSTGSAQATVERNGMGNAAIMAGDVTPSADRIELVDIRIERLDDVALPSAYASRRCCLVKMDVEGFEMDALAGAREFVQRHRPIIYGEFNTWFLDRRGVDRQAPQVWAQRHDYECYELHHRRTHLWSDGQEVIGHDVSQSTVRGSESLLLLPRGSSCSWPALLRGRRGDRLASKSNLPGAS